MHVPRDLSSLRVDQPSVSANGSAFSPLPVSPSTLGDNRRACRPSGVSDPPQPGSNVSSHRSKAGRCHLLSLPLNAGPLTPLHFLLAPGYPECQKSARDSRTPTPPRQEYPQGQKRSASPMLLHLRTGPTNLRPVHNQDRGSLLQAPVGGGAS